MTSDNVARDINELLDPLLFQVVGSTPESIRDVIKESSLRDNPDAAKKLVMLCLYGSAVNKVTMSNFLAKPELSDARTVVANSISIGNSPNMTAITLLGHCFISTDSFDKVNFVVQFRRKMGQHDIWSGNMDAGTLSDLQKKILLEKARVTSLSSAKLLADGFIKFTGMSRAAFTNDEAEFWGERANIPEPDRANEPTPRTAPSARQRYGSSNISPPGSVSGSIPLTLTDGSVVSISRDVYDYYLAVNSNDSSRLISSVMRNGASSFISKYRTAAALDPEKRGNPGGTVVG